ncbi:hypothetical protein ULF88_01445 [Halopseudomonas pachastrellae]|nr:hypothetical protein [Halopseudomonas pachastrellae]
MLLRLLGAVDRVTEWVEKIILGSSVLFLAGLLIVHVLGRQLFGNGVTGQVELTQISLVIMTFSGLGYAVRRAPTSACPPSPTSSAARRARR